MPSKRNGSPARSRSRKGRSVSRSGTPARARTPASSRSRRRSNSTPPSQEVRAPKEAPAISMWEADAKLMAAMHRRRSRGMRGFFRNEKVRLWGYWAAVIMLQVMMIVWAKWAVDMYKSYKASH
ncbi:protein of unknown function - conserved [Leishmania donovani]|uniref:Uncharacterized protein n=3 Tax=Leishmania donovani species complex TaxID=38574 RepID=E9AHI1_LEIIN|nr:conserved hypothetical protein [Leishmania infantum JPCM5]XP_003862449.1 hypothetical protein, conserved [Leishmania donovani]CAC9506938.1 hypothetical_protein [Leishmania infantum]AYU80517.1 hypothetical protein LdCL_290008000 [Leishmania donovani]TPP50869.1 hypothetical protein CGC20_25910 [Leishmania donovani]TPP52666.1 hypothetical protein CGC21_27705 [Leishmania donovani]CAJ1990501.1 protein of unknown function - conserved [Leishmania donovani]|eukprot:XP_003392682.1 conserved hypothetical protein [Leishmania infantum JPCM5]